MTLEELPAAYALARAEALRDAVLDKDVPNLCRYCGTYRQILAGSSLDGHALCMVTHEFRSELRSLWRSNMNITRIRLAEILGVSVSLIEVWTSFKPRKKKKE